MVFFQLNYIRRLRAEGHIYEDGCDMSVRGPTMQAVVSRMCEFLHNTDFIPELDSVTLAYQEDSKMTVLNHWVWDEIKQFFGY